MNTQDDIGAIREVHDRWFAANIGLDIEKMLPCFPAGDGYLQYNLNGFTYRGAADKARLWRNLTSIGASITRIADLTEPDIQVFGDVALLTGEGEAELLLPTPSGRLESSGATRFRNTEFLRRDDGAGNADWRIWHMHISEFAADGQPKYGTE